MPRPLSAPLLLLLALGGCGRKEPLSVLVPVGFLPAVTITPSARTMHRGDTLWLEANFSDSLLDYHSGKRYRVQPQDLALSSYIAYRQLLGVGQDPIGIAPTFRLVEKVGHASIDGTFTGSFEPVYDGHRYRAKIGLIPTKAGIASIFMAIVPANNVRLSEVPLLSFISLPHDAEGRPQKAELDESFYNINDGQASNFDLLQQNSKTFSQESDAPLKNVIYERKSTFTVEVK